VVHFNITRYKLVASGSALFAALFSILLLILISISINDTSERLETANAFKMQYGNELDKRKRSNNVKCLSIVPGNNDIAQEIYHYRVKLGLMIVILMDSLVALCVNILLAMASYSLQPAYFPN
jgi:hypothetical protein